MKEGICTAVGVVGSAIAAAFGGWDQALVTLVIFMVIDYLSGLIVAGIFRNSRKTENGALESRAGWKGLCRKGVTLLFVLIAYRLDLALGVNYIRNAVIIGFMANELISITENAGLMGIPLPTVIQNAIEVLTRKASCGYYHEFCGYLSEMYRTFLHSACNCEYLQKWNPGTRLRTAADDGRCC